MKVYRLCNRDEAESILKNRKFENIDFDYVPEIEEIYENLTIFYDCQYLKKNWKIF